MQTKNIANLIEWLKATHPELLKFFLKPKSGGVELDENYLQENPTRIFTPISIFEAKIITDRVTGMLKELQDFLKNKGAKNFEAKIDEVDNLIEEESAQNTYIQNVFFPSLNRIMFGKGSDEDMEIVQQRFDLYAKANTTGSYIFV